MPEKVTTYQSVEFSRMESGQVQRERAGNRVQLEDANGNPYTANNQVPFTSPDMIALLQQIKAILDDTITVSGTVAITSSTLNSILAALQGTLSVTPTTLQPNVFKTIDAVSIASEATIWTPASGKKFRLMGGLLSVIGAVGNVSLKDGSSTFLMLPNVALATPLLLNLGEGKLSSAANNVLKVSGAALQVMNGTVWGAEND